MWEYMNDNDFSWESKSVMGRAESALKRDFAEERLVLAPSHFSLAALFPEANSVILYPCGEESFSRMTAASGSSKPVRYQKSDACLCL